MNANQLLKAAQAETGLDDLGDDSFQEGLSVLVRSLDREARLHERGRQAAEERLMRTLAIRLQIEQWYNAHPEIDDQEIPAPLFQLGLPRTGTTALGNLLAQDPSVRYLRVWESTMPVPPPDSSRRNDPRISDAADAQQSRHDATPRIRAMVPASATGPAECLGLLMYHFQSASFCGAWVIPSYAEWLWASDMEPAYRYHQRILKLLQWKWPPNRWRLRTPAHMLAIDALDRVYPDARFVMTHRDVASVIPSVADLHTTLAIVHTDQPVAEFFGGFCARQWETALRRALAFRDAGNEHRFHDLLFREVQQDPIESVRKLYDSLGEELSPKAEQRMAAWWADNPRDQHGGHTYTPEQFGVTADELRERFAFYRERFDLPLER